MAKFRTITTNDYKTGLASRGPRRRGLHSRVVLGAKTGATLTTALTGTNNDLKYSTVNRGLEGNDIRIRYVVSGNDTPLSVSVSGKDITVNVATDGSGEATSTAAQVKTAIDASAPAAALVSTANATGNDGTGVVTALAFTALSGGLNHRIGS